MDFKKTPRIIIPSNPRPRSTVTSGPLDNTPDSVISTALQTVAMEVTKLHIKVSRGTSLDQKEARILQGYIKSMVELSREQRERDRADDLSKLSTEELAKIAEKMLKQEAGTIEIEEDEEAAELEDE